MAVNTIKWSNSNVARTVWCFWLSACKYVSIFKEFATDYSNASFEQCRVVLVWHFYDHKCRRGVKPETHCTIFGCPRRKLGIAKQSWPIRNRRDCFMMPVFRLGQPKIMQCVSGFMFARRGAMHKSVSIISNYVLTECNKCLVYSGFYCFSLIAPGHGIKTWEGA